MKGSVHLAFSAPLSLLPIEGIGIRSNRPPATGRGLGTKLVPRETNHPHISPVCVLTERNKYHCDITKNKWSVRTQTMEVDVGIRFMNKPLFNKPDSSEHPVPILHRDQRDKAYGGATAPMKC
jgi:hypothetical protein